MYTFQVEEMSCGHCVGAVTQAVRGLDPDAVVNVDLAAKTVTVDSAVPSAEVAAAIIAAGYPVAAGAPG